MARSFDFANGITLLNGFPGQYPDSEAGLSFNPQINSPIFGLVSFPLNDLISPTNG
jgi:hypothetical protein